MIRFTMLGGLLLALAFAAPAQDKKDVPKDLVPFQGKWTVVEASADGKPAPKEALNLQFTFDGEKVTIKEGSRDAETGSYAVGAKQEPAHIDITTPKGEKVLGIYKFDKDSGKLTICFDKGKDAARPKGFDAKTGVILVLEKQKK